MQLLLCYLTDVLSLISFTIMINFNENQNSGGKKITWVQIVNAVVQAVIAALTALGVSSCANIL